MRRKLPPVLPINDACQVSIDSIYQRHSSHLPRLNPAAVTTTAVRGADLILFSPTRASIGGSINLRTRRPECARSSPCRRTRAGDSFCSGTTWIVPQVVAVHVDFPALSRGLYMVTYWLVNFHASNSTVCWTTHNTCSCVTMPHRICNNLVMIRTVRSENHKVP
jgi:hypothetical protein